jgi:hypothetical protein
MPGRLLPRGLLVPSPRFVLHRHLGIPRVPLHLSERLQHVRWALLQELLRQHLLCGWLSGPRPASFARAAAAAAWAMTAGSDGRESK